MTKALAASSSSNMMARIHPLLTFALLLSSAGALRVPMRAGRLVCAAPAGTKQLYSKIDTVLRRACMGLPPAPRATRRGQRGVRPSARAHAP